MQKFLYCDSCFLIGCFQEGKLALLSQYKNIFFISKAQLDGELIKPAGIASAVRKVISIIENDRSEILHKTKEFAEMYSTLSFYDCLCMAYASLDDYCLVTDDHALQKKCRLHHIEFKASSDVLSELLKNH